MFTRKDEEDFLFTEINNTQRVLEYGSGSSTSQIAKKCLSIISIEHQQNWFNRYKNAVPDNCTLLLRKPNLPYMEGRHCGAYDEFKDYIETPLSFGPFDVIFIDGRARVGCASICNKLGHKDTIVFIHDFHRPEYQEALQYLNLISVVGTMAKFKIK